MKPLGGDIAVLGTGVTGAAVSRYVLDEIDRGARVKLTVYDERDGEPQNRVATEMRERGAAVVLGAAEIGPGHDLVVASPGIPPSAKLICSARERAARVISEIEFAFERSTSPWVAVTGTNGKTTVTSLVAHILRGAGMPVECVGNIGDPAISIVAASGPSTIIVAEVSSFQLALTESFRPRVALLLNITPDHLDWHGSLEAYARDKTRIFANMGDGDVAVVDVDDPGSAPYAASLRARDLDVAPVSRRMVPSGGAGLVGDSLVLDTHSGEQVLLSRDELHIRGDHNLSNALAAARAVSALGVTPALIADGLRSFVPIAHRLEPVATRAGVEYVNDSKATNPGATRMALTAFADRSVVLLLGGRNKGNDFTELCEDVRGCRAVVAFGESGGEIAQALEGCVTLVRAVGMRDAVEVAQELALEGDAVLLSPACASFDEFSGYAERGDVFRAAVGAVSES